MKVMALDPGIAEGQIVLRERDGVPIGTEKSVYLPGEPVEEGDGGNWEEGSKVPDVRLKRRWI